MAFRPAPLNKAFMLIAIVGFLVSATYIWSFSKPWAFSFGLVFALMFIAAIISLSRAPAPSAYRTARKVIRVRKMPRKTVQRRKAKKAGKKSRKRKAKKRRRR